MPRFEPPSLRLPKGSRQSRARYCAGSEFSASDAQRLPESPTFDHASERSSWRLTSARRWGTGVPKEDVPQWVRLWFDRMETCTSRNTIEERRPIAQQHRADDQQVLVDWWISITRAKWDRFVPRYAFARTASSARTTARAISRASDTRTFTQFGAPPSGVTRSSNPPSRRRRWITPAVSRTSMRWSP
jgi:hypothetical protein